VWLISVPTGRFYRCRFAFAQSKASWGRPMSRLGQPDAGHEGVITGRDGFSLRSSIANPQGVVQPPLQSTYLHSIRLTKLRYNFW